MGKYGYKIKKQNGKYCFVLYPNNNHGQPFGRSKEYPTLEKCEKAIKDFKDFIVTYNLKSVDDNKINILKVSRTNDSISYFRYIVQYIENGEVIFSTREYDTKKNYEGIIESLYKYIDECTTNYLEE